MEGERSCPDLAILGALHRRSFRLRDKTALLGTDTSRLQLPSRVHPPNTLLKEFIRGSQFPTYTSTSRPSMLFTRC